MNRPEKQETKLEQIVKSQVDDFIELASVEGLGETSELSQIAKIFDKDIPRSPKQWFIRGLMTPLYGLSILMKYKKLSWYFILPIIVQSVIAALIWGVLYLMLQPIVGWSESLITRTFNWISGGVFSESVENGFGDFILHFIVWSLVVLVGIYIFVVLWRMTGGIVTGYFAGKLTDAAMREMNLDLGNSKFTVDDRERTSLVGEVINALLNVGLLSLSGPLAAGTLAIPLLGPFVAAATVPMFGMFIQGADQLFDPLSHFGMSRIKALRFCSKFKSATIGVGFSTNILQPVPFIGGIAEASGSLGRILIAKQMVDSLEQKQTVATEALNIESERH